MNNNKYNKQQVKTLRRENIWVTKLPHYNETVQLKQKIWGMQNKLWPTYKEKKQLIKTVPEVAQILSLLKNT